MPGIGIGISPSLRRGGGQSWSSYWATRFEYFVDSVNGDDDNNGTSYDTPWKTIAKVNAATFQPGDRIGLKKGSEWRETLIVPSDGEVGNAITFGVYYDGDGGENPILNGCDIVTGWSADTATWKDGPVVTGAAVGGDWANTSVRNIIPANTYVSGTKVRVSFKATGGNAVISGVGIGVMTTGAVFDNTPTRITFDGGNNGCTITNGTTVVSDEIDFVFDKTKRHGLSMFSTNAHYLTWTGPGGDSYYRLSGTDQSNTTTFSIQGTDPHFNMFDKLEIYGSYPGVYNASVTMTAPHTVYRDDVYQTRGTSKATLADHQWYYAAGVLSYRDDTGDPDLQGYVIEASTRPYVLTTNNKTNIVVSDSINRKYGNYKRFLDNYLASPFGASHTEPSALVSDDGNRLDVWFGNWYVYSTDGVSFSAEQALVIDTDISIGMVHVMKVGATYYMYAIQNGTNELHLLTSTDRVNWADQGVVLSDVNNVYNSFIWHEGENWFMLYEGAGGGFKINLATASAPEGPWTKYAGNPVIAIGKNGTGQPEMMRVNNEIIKKDGNYYLYHAGPVSNSITREYSADLHTWTVDGVTLNNRDFRGLPYISFEDFCLVEFKGKSYMFYAPSSQDGTFTIDCCIDNRSHAELLALAP